MAEFDDNELGALDDLDKFEDFEFDKEGEEGEGEGERTKRDSRLDLILDIPLTVTVELGRSKMLIHDLLQLGQGSVIELTKMVGEPLEVLVNDKLVARGEVVVVNEKFGVRLTDIVSPMERVQSLG
ncbi:flagellar motor switch protein FliN [Nitrospina gracilis]|uniref:flagellar motor switch protein FliN n=1 Tax=Nitrospina gracilis TaxID=35801 RepID=UPI001F031853|nr:flagellar motor switch protein FliN [Nitrospina gracilis]MCF8720290.1 flagellar motor switch protein FliN/FliY [Nitrospina gracilis Nb-211]